MSSTKLVNGPLRLSEKPASSRYYQPIGYIRSCYKSKFGTPRQPGLIKQADAQLQLLPPYNQSAAVNGLEGYSHIWLIFNFHANKRLSAKRLWVRPPRWGGNKKTGIFASRSGFRPNSLGLSAVQLVAIRQQPEGPLLVLKGIDLIDGTPILDIKPYLPYTDAIDTAQAPVSEPAPLDKEIVWQPAALTFCQQQAIPHLVALIEDIVRTDPRPAYHESSEREYGMALYHFNVKWQVQRDNITIRTVSYLNHRSEVIDQQQD
jgi:tRNA-Thr(GGU) m(6)t(6)A37 methyltransferase TsaA